MRIKTNHKRFVECNDGILKIEFWEEYMFDRQFNIEMNFSFKKSHNERFVYCGQADFYVYLGSLPFNDILESHNSRWESYTVWKIWDSENQMFKSEYQKFENSFQDMVFSLTEIYLKEKFRGQGLLKIIINEFKKMYHFGTILTNVFTLYEPGDDRDFYKKSKMKMDLKKVDKAFKNVEFQSFDCLPYCQYLEIEEKINIYEQNHDFFKQNSILWHFYNLDYVKDIFRDLKES